MSGSTKKPTAGNAPLNDPWFEDSGPVIKPEAEKPEEQRERKERTSIPKVVVKP